MTLSEREWAALQPQSIFHRLPAEDFKQFVASGRTARYRKGDGLYRERDPADGVWLVTSGWVRVYRVTRDGDEKVLLYRKAGQVVGDAAWLARSEHGHAALAYSDCDTIFFDRNSLNRVLETHSSLLREFVRTLAEDCEMLQQDLVDACGFDVRTKVLLGLLSLGQRYGRVEPDGGCRLPFPMSHQELAYFVGTTRESISRICGALPSVQFDQKTLCVMDWREFQALHG